MQLRTQGHPALTRYSNVCRIGQGSLSGVAKCAVWLMAATVLAVSMPWCAPAAGTSTNSVSKKIRQNILNEFQQWAENYATTAPSNKTRLFAGGLSLATERRKTLAALIESDPREALRQALPVGLRAQLPTEIVAQL